MKMSKKLLQVLKLELHMIALANCYTKPVPLPLAEVVVEKLLLFRFDKLVTEVTQ